MPSVSNIIFCLDATNSDEHGACAKTILSALNPEYIPGLFTFSVIIVLLDVDLSKTHQLAVDFINSIGENVVNVRTSISTMNKIGNLPEQYQGINIVMDWNNVNLKVSGKYTIKVTMDEKFLEEKTIFVKGRNES